MTNIALRYNLVFLLVTYLVPVVAMAVCYSLMGRELWGSKSIGEQTQRQLDNIKSKRKVVRMFITVIAIFAICWLPYHGYFIYAYHNRSVTFSSYVPHIYLAFYWLAMSNAMVNPIIYYWMNNKFRVYFRQVICFCCCIKHNVQIENQSHQVNMEFIRRSKSCKRQGPLSEVSRLAADLSSGSSSAIHLEAVCHRFEQFPKGKHSKQYLDSRYD